jgi:hypothetical protein
MWKRIERFENRRGFIEIISYTENVYTFRVTGKKVVYLQSDGEPPPGDAKLQSDGLGRVASVEPDVHRLTLARRQRVDGREPVPGYARGRPRRRTQLDLGHLRVRLVGQAKLECHHLGRVDRGGATVTTRYLQPAAVPVVEDRLERLGRPWGTGRLFQKTIKKRLNCW